MAGSSEDEGGERCMYIGVELGLNSGGDFSRLHIVKQSLVQYECKTVIAFHWI